MAGVILITITACCYVGILLGRVEHPQQGDGPVDPPSDAKLPKPPRERLHEEGPFR